MERLSFLVIGAQKAGTTTLWQLLREHPQLSLPGSKEAPFFSEPAFDDGIEPYLATYFRGDDGTRLRGTVSPQYMMGTPTAPVPLVARRIAETFPDVRLVALLRDPVERAVSQWRMSRRWDLEPRALDSALSAALEPAARAEARQRPDATNSYVVQGEYGRTLAAYLRWFPREQLHVELTASLEREPRAVIARVLTFLGVDASWEPADPEGRWFVGGERARVDRAAGDDLLRRLYRDAFPLAGEAMDEVARAFHMTFTQWNVAPKPPPPLDGELEQRLRRHFADDAVVAERLLGLRLPWSVAAPQAVR